METQYYGYRLILMFIIIGINGFFAGAETALVSVRPSRLKAMAERGNVGAQAALSLLAQPERLLSVVQVGVTLTSLALGGVGEDTLFDIFYHFFEPVITPATKVVLHGVALVIAFIIMTFFHVTLGEVVPKNVAISKADRLAVLVAPALLVFAKVCEPFVWIIERSATALSRLAGVVSASHGGAHSAEELKFIVTAAHGAGHIDMFEQEAIQNLLDLQDYAVREVMVPRHDLVMVPVNADIDEVLQVVTESRYSRLPVYENDRENIIGIVHVKDVLDFWTQRRQSNLRRRSVHPFNIRTILRRALVIPETKPLNQVLNQLRQEHAHVALVVDEFGTITGLISMEDVIEQVFGEIEDEFDPQASLPSLEADTVEVEGTIPILDLDTQYGIELPGDLEFETLAGFLLFQLGRIPDVGDAIIHDGRKYTVLEMDYNRIAKVRIDRLPEIPPEAAPASPVLTE